MAFFKILFIMLFLVLLGGFAYFAITDVPVPQTDKIEAINLPQESEQTTGTTLENKEKTSQE